MTWQTDHVIILNQLTNNHSVTMLQIGESRCLAFNSSYGPDEIYTAVDDGGFDDQRPPSIEKNGSDFHVQVMNGVSYQSEDAICSGKNM